MQNLLESWESQFKKGQLALWLLLSLADGDKTSKEILGFIQSSTDGYYSFEEQSMYRTLRKFTELGLLTFKEQRSELGPNTKVFTITEEGKALLKLFIERNLNIFTTSKFNSLVKNI